jgi:hypothetical protein
MLSGIKTEFANSLTSVFQVGLMFLGFQIGGKGVWLLIMPVMAVLSFAAWFANHHRYKVITGIPLSKTVSAAQGYVGLLGTAEAHGGVVVAGALQGLPAVWRRYVVEDVDNRHTEVIDRGTSFETFLLRDEQGACVIDADDAEVITSHKHVFHEGGYRHTEYYLLPGDTLFAMGEFSTKSDAGLGANTQSEVSDLLAEWKRDKAGLLRRFDKNNDGEIDLREWELAREEAQRTIEKSRLETKPDEGLHMMHKPGSGRLYLLSNLKPEQLAAKYRYWAWFHLLAFFTALAIAVLMF